MDIFMSNIFATIITESGDVITEKLSDILHDKQRIKLINKHIILHGYCQKVIGCAMNFGYDDDDWYTIESIHMFPRSLREIGISDNKIKLEVENAFEYEIRKYLEQ